MNKDVKGMLKDAVILLVITLISGLVLGYVYKITKEPIAAQKEKAKMEACQNVFADAAGFALMEDATEEKATAAISSEYPEQSINEVMSALDDSGNTIGYVITVTSHEGYGGDIQFSMGLTIDGKLNGISLLSIAETAGLGMRADEVLTPQFVDKPISIFEYTKNGATADNQIDTISGATITTNAVVNGVNAGVYYFQNQLEGGTK